MRRRQRKRENEEVSLNLAAMLDMAFQLLAFFILTFKPSPAEAELKLNLPDPNRSRIVEADDLLVPNPLPGENGARSLSLTIVADRNGQVTSVSVGFAKLFDGPLDAPRLRQLDRRLKEIFAIAGAPFDQVLVRVDRKLHYGDLMRIIDVCTRQKTADGSELEKISFAELPEK
jgi:biopolymer transport protein ExbD